MNKFHEDILAGIPAVLPEPKPYDPKINHAPKRKEILSAEERYWQSRTPSDISLQSIMLFSRRNLHRS